MGLRISFPALVGQQNETEGLTGLLFENSYKVRVFTEYPGQVRPLVLLCRQGKAQAVLSIEVLQ